MVPSLGNHLLNKAGQLIKPRIAEFVLASETIEVEVSFICEHAGRLRAEFGEKIVAFVVDNDKGGEILHLDVPNGFHPELRIF